MIVLGFEFVVVLVVCLILYLLVVLSYGCCVDFGGLLDLG